jgi:hypothetical protein
MDYETLSTMHILFKSTFPFHVKGWVGFFLHFFCAISLFEFYYYYYDVSITFTTHVRKVYYVPYKLQYHHKNNTFMKYNFHSSLALNLTPPSSQCKRKLGVFLSYLFGQAIPIIVI